MRQRYNGREPYLGKLGVARANGREPSLSGAFSDLYGSLHLIGLEAPPVVGRRKPLVILAEYDRSAAELVTLLAVSNGYDVRTEADGLRALHMARALEPNLMAINRRLFGIDGLELVRRLRIDQNVIVAKVPIVMMDIRLDSYSVMGAFRMGADDFLEMPYDLQEMLRTWKRLVAQVRRPSPVMALLSNDKRIRQCAVNILLDDMPQGLHNALQELLFEPDPNVRRLAEWLIERVGVPGSKNLPLANGGLFSE